MRVNGRTRITGIFGDPIEHTLSPAIQNAAFEALGLHYIYVPFHVRSKPSGDLKAAVAGVRAMNIAGVNITIPHKERVIRLLDEVDIHAKDIGAVNTVVNRDGKLIGYNTDGPGYLLSLRDETGFIPRGKNIIVVGAGGASRAIFHAFLAGGAKSILLVNRTVKRADALANEFSGRFKARVETAPLETEWIKKYAESADLLVNTTSIGMMGRGELELPLEAFPSKAVISDIVYRPLKTGLLKGAEKRGLKTHTGIGMLVRQGAIGFELWTGEKAPVNVMLKAALRQLKAR